MAKKVLDKKTNVNGEEVIVIQTTEETLNYEALLRKKEYCQRRKQRLILDSQRIKEEYDIVDIEEKEIDEMITMLGEKDGIEILEG